MKIISIFLMLLASTASAIASEESNSGGWVVFQRPYIDAHYGKIPGLARRIHSAWIMHDAPSISTLVITYLDSQTVRLRFLVADHAEAFLREIQNGGTVDVTSCEHLHLVETTPRDRIGCFDRIYEAEFHCDAFSLSDNPQIITGLTVSAEEFEIQGTNKIEVRHAIPVCSTREF